MIVVSDASPIIALSRINRARLLSELFQKIIIPEAVRDELLAGGEALPAGLTVLHTKDAAHVTRLRQSLDQGEAEAIVLAKGIRADGILIDERKGRRVALDEGLKVIGLVGALVAARQQGLIPTLRPLLDELQSKATFYISSTIKEQALRAVGENVA